MEIFYLRKSEFLKSISKESLEYFSDDRKYSNNEKYVEHVLGLFLTKFVAKNIYDIENTQIVVKNHKPEFEFGNLVFSISHSNDIVLVAFNNKNVGVDVEYIKERDNFKEIMTRYGEVVENPSSLDFYRFWTLHEAEIKLGLPIKSIFSTIMENEYIVSCVSADVLVSTFCVKKLVCKGLNIDLKEEYDNPKNCQLLVSVE